MEYANITVICGGQSAGMLETVIMHEVGHNWFYGMLGSNERVHPWMDEGINSANELRYNETKYPNGALIGGKNGPNEIAGIFGLSRYKQKAQYYQLFALTARQDIDQPCEMHSADYTSINYGGIVYSKTAVCFDYLRGYLGDSIYDKCFRTYFDRWHFKHPQPADLRTTFEEVSGKQLGWFFDDLIGTTKKLDYKLTSAKKNNGTWELNIKNCGEIAAPVCVTAIKDGKVVKSVWYEGFTGTSSPNFIIADADYFIIDQPEDAPEINRKNNIIKTHGICKKTEPLRLQFVGSFDNPTRTQLFFSPVMGFNNYDKFMIGAAFYNHVLPQKTFEWVAMPMYSFGSGKVVGHADAFLNFRKCGIFQSIRIGVNANQYNFYKIQPEDHPADAAPDRELMFQKVAPEIGFTFRKKRMRSPISHQIVLRAIWTKQEYIDVSVDSNSVSWGIGSSEKTFYEAKYMLRNNRNVHPWSLEAKYQQGDNMSKLSLVANYTVNYANGKGIHFRFFGGTFLDKGNTGPYRWRMSGYGSRGLGNHDYLFDHIFLGRSEETGALGAQFVEQDGAFKIYSPIGQSNNWLVAMNVKIDLPVKSRLLNKFKLYADFGTSSADALADQSFLYNAGVQFSLLGNGICDVYFPLLWSKDIANYYDATGQGYTSMIRFTFNIGQFGLANLANSISNGF